MLKVDHKLKVLKTKLSMKNAKYTFHVSTFVLNVSYLTIHNSLILTNILKTLDKNCVLSIKVNLLQPFNCRAFGMKKYYLHLKQIMYLIHKSSLK